MPSLKKISPDVWPESCSLTARQTDKRTDMEKLILGEQVQLRDNTDTSIFCVNVDEQNASKHKDDQII